MSQSTVFERARFISRVLLAAVLSSTGPALAQVASSATLTLPAGSAVTLRPAGVPLKGPQQVPLTPGAQVCVSAGSATISLGGVRRVVGLGRCYQVPAPRSLVGSLLSVVQSWVPRSRQAGTANAESRGDARCPEQSPGIALPRDFPLNVLKVPIMVPPHPRVLEVYGSRGQRLYRAEQGQPDRGFEVPVALLRLAGRVDVRDGLGDLIYSGDVRQVDFPVTKVPAGAAGLTEKARQLLDTGLVEYVLPAYSLLDQAGERQAADQLLHDVIEVCFVGP
ncbi:hypothetical protein [Deinococcus navajonensis]|uniref:Uncharacterized protein n=1 Tax=Deinococcus navajonensis TaxID=309884 RepID=A0ABV8XN39_9DEIO